MHKIDSAKKALKSIEYPAKNNKRCLRIYANHNWNLKVIFEESPVNYAQNQTHSRAMMNNDEQLRSMQQSKLANYSNKNRRKLIPLHTNRDSVSYLEGEISKNIDSPKSKELAVSSLNTIVNNDNEWPRDSDISCKYSCKVEANIKRQGYFKHKLMELLRKNTNRSQLLKRGGMFYNKETNL